GMDRRAPRQPGPPCGGRRAVDGSGPRRSIGRTAMIHEIDEALRTLVRRDAVNGTDVEVLFDAPTKDWAARRNAPTVDIYLYDIREDMKWRAYGSSDVR